MDNNIKEFEAIGRRIRSEREKLRLTREQFAEAVDISPMYMGQIERGQRVMSLKTFIKIANSLHVSTDYLIYGSSEKENLKGKATIYELLERCSERELKVAEEMLKPFITYIK